MESPMAMALRFLATVTPVAVCDQPGSIGGNTLMSYSARLDALKQRHASLEDRILDEDQRPRPDSDTLMRLKLEKLHLKEEMEKLLTLAHEEVH
jgi:hypothetical protein